MTYISVYLRFYEELNDFLPVEKHKQEFTVLIEKPRSVKWLIESLGVPNTEVDLILVNGESVPFTYWLENGDRISVYPIFETFDVSSVTKLRERPLRELKSK